MDKRIMRRSYPLHYNTGALRYEYSCGNYSQCNCIDVGTIANAIVVTKIPDTNMNIHSPLVLMVMLFRSVQAT